MPVSGCPTLWLRGHLFELSAGGASWFALHLLACWLACVKGHFARLFSSLFSLSTLPLVSIWSGKYSTDWVQCDGAFGGGRSQGCHGYLPRASLLPGSTNLFRHHVPSSSIVDEFKRVEINTVEFNSLPKRQRGILEKLAVGRCGLVKIV